MIDPGNSVRKDLTELVEYFETVERRFSSLVSHLASANSKVKASPRGRRKGSTPSRDSTSRPSPSPSRRKVSTEQSPATGQTKVKSEADPQLEYQPGVNPSPGEQSLSLPAAEVQTVNPHQQSPEQDNDTEGRNSDSADNQLRDIQAVRAEAGSVSSEPVVEARSGSSRVEDCSFTWTSTQENIGTLTRENTVDNQSRLSDLVVDNVPSQQGVGPSDAGLKAEDASSQITSRDESFGHYEECTVSSTLTVPRPSPVTAVVERSEVFITMKTLSRRDSSEPKLSREISELEQNLRVCERFLDSVLCLQDSVDLEDEVTEVHSHLHLLADAFVPASLTEDESADVLNKLLDVKARLREREKEAKGLIDKLAQLREEISGLSLWMKEVGVFLEAEDAAFGDIETLEAQLKESNALQVSHHSARGFLVRIY